MSSKVSINNYINKKNQYEVEEKNVFKYKKPLINNNNISNGLNDNKTKYNYLKNKETQKKEVKSIFGEKGIEIGNISGIAHRLNSLKVLRKKIKNKNNSETW